MSNDSQLQQAVLAELKWEPSIDAGHIGVTAHAGVVTLTGHVQNYSQKQAAEAAAKRVKGAKAVAEEIEVKLPFDFKRDDEEIAAAAIDRLAWDASVPRDVLKIRVEKGWLTLTGQVDWHFQKEAAEDDVSGLFGVVGVSNQVLVKPQVNASDVSEDIRTALHRSWFYDPNKITVTARDGKIKLTVKVESWRDRDVAATTAWAAPGAVSVENDIIII